MLVGAGIGCMRQAAGLVKKARGCQRLKAVAEVAEEWQVAAGRFARLLSPARRLPPSFPRQRTARRAVRVAQRTGTAQTRHAPRVARTRRRVRVALRATHVMPRSAVSYNHSA